MSRNCRASKQITSYVLFCKYNFAFWIICVQSWRIWGGGEEVEMRSMKCSSANETEKKEILIFFGKQKLLHGGRIVASAHVCFTCMKHNKVFHQYDNIYRERQSLEYISVRQIFSRNLIKTKYLQNFNVFAQFSAFYFICK